MKRAPGFSLVECVVAVVLCAAGLLALAGSTRATIGLAELGQRTAGAAEVAAARLAVLKGSRCPVTSGQATSGPYAERWTVGADGARQSVAVEVASPVSGVRRTARYEALLPCPR